jgi:hypothetical protein
MRKIGRLSVVPTGEAARTLPPVPDHTAEVERVGCLAQYALDTHGRSRRPPCPCRRLQDQLPTLHRIKGCVGEVTEGEPEIVSLPVTFNMKLTAQVLHADYVRKRTLIRVIESQDRKGIYR